LNVADVSTTYITGTLTSLMARTVRLLRSASPERAEGRTIYTEPSERGLPLTADVWLAYGVGAVVGGAAELLWQPAALLLPVAAVAGVVCSWQRVTASLESHGVNIRSCLKCLNSGPNRGLL
jgi:uncharacterized membrane protein YoaK (UPF0700 family)